MPSQKITPIHYSKIIKIFQLEGFIIRRQKGDHIIMTKPGMKRPVVIKTSPHEVPVTDIRTKLTNAGISRERYFRLLSRVK